MKIISIVFDSKYGSNKQIAISISERLSMNQKLKINLIHVKDVNQHWKDLSESDGIIFGCPTFMGGVSAEFKKFMESSSIYFSSQKWKNKFATGYTCSSAASGDKLGTLLQMFLFAAQHGMHWVNLGLGNAGNVYLEDDSENLNRLGCWMGAMLQVKSNTIGGENVPLSDLKTAEYLANRLASVLLGEL